jgi:mRNA deadenylase 3'-5' endonuclease subunit Ccr4
VRSSYIKVKIILSEDPDIIGLQEVDEGIADFFMPYLEQAGYDYVFRKRPTKFKSDGCVIIWKKERFAQKSKDNLTDLNFSAIKNNFINKNLLEEYKRNNIIVNILLQDVSLGN